MRKREFVGFNLSRWRPLSYRNQSIDLQSKSMDWFLYDNGLRLERVNCFVRYLYAIHHGLGASNISKTNKAYLSNFFIFHP